MCDADKVRQNQSRFCGVCGEPIATSEIPPVLSIKDAPAYHRRCILRPGHGVDDQGLRGSDEHRKEQT